VKRTIVTGCLLVFLAGCGQTTAQPPQPRPTAHLVAAIPLLIPSLEKTAGRLLAASTLLHRVDGALWSAYNLQSIQLPESAHAALAEARPNVDGARRVTANLQVPAAYSPTARLLTRAFEGLAAATESADAILSASKSEEGDGRIALEQADARLATDPQARGPLAGQAQRTWLVLAAEYAAAFAPRVRPTLRPSPTPMRRRVHVVLTRSQHAVRRASVRPMREIVTVTPTLTAVTSRTPVAYRINRERQHGARRTVTPTATATPTAVPVYLAAVIQSETDAFRAATRIAQCSGYLRRLAGGNDPLGARKLLQCVDRVVRRLHRAIGLLLTISAARRHSFWSDHLTSARLATARAITGVWRARQNVVSGDTIGARTQLASAADMVHKALSQMALLPSS
jgi:hypothetical protein